MPSAAPRFLGVELPLFYLMLFVFLLVSLIFSSDLIANFGLISKDDLIKVIGKQPHSDPEILTRYLNPRSRSKNEIIEFRLTAGGLHYEQCDYGKTKSVTRVISLQLV